MSFLDLLSDPEFGGANYTVTRTALGAHGADGLYVAGAPSTFTMNASIQPQRGQVLKVGPEGQTGESVRVVYSDVYLIAAPHPDSFTYDGATWKVFEVNPWDAFGEDPCVSYIAKIGVPS